MDSQEMKRFKKKRFKVIMITLTVLATLWFIVLCYVYTADRPLSPDGSIYYASKDGVGWYYSFTDGDRLDAFYCAEDMSVAGKVELEYSGYMWNRLVGPWYFSEARMLSLTKVESGRPATMTIVCTEAFALTLFEDGSVRKSVSEDMVGSKGVSKLLFYENSLVMDGSTYEKVAAVDPFITELVEQFEN